MVNAAKDLNYRGKVYLEGEKLPEEAVKQFELHNPSNLSNYIEINARWIKIDDPSIKGIVEKEKEHDERLKKHFNIKPKKEEVKKEDNSNMARVRPKKYTKDELKEMSFLELRKVGEKLGVVDRSKKGLIKEILAKQ